MRGKIRKGKDISNSCIFFIYSINNSFFYKNKRYSLIQIDRKHRHNTNPKSLKTKGMNLRKNSQYPYIQVFKILMSHIYNIDDAKIFDRNPLGLV